MPCYPNIVLSHPGPYAGMTWKASEVMARPHSRPKISEALRQAGHWHIENFPKWHLARPENDCPARCSLFYYFIFLLLKNLYIYAYNFNLSVLLSFFPIYPTPSLLSSSLLLPRLSPVRVKHVNNFVCTVPYFVPSLIVLSMHTHPHIFEGGSLFYRSGLLLHPFPHLAFLTREMPQVTCNSFGSFLWPCGIHSVGVP